MLRCSPAPGLASKLVDVWECLRGARSWPAALEAISEEFAVTLAGLCARLGKLNAPKLESRITPSNTNSDR